MKRPEFAERQYETAAHIELARGRASPFVPTQTIEAYIGIDAAADPEKAHAIWRILSVQIPRRVQLSPALWPALPPQFHSHIPGQFCSLFMQFKRPVYQDNRRAKYHRWIGGPYFEVGITAHQQKALSRLETRVASLAVVRYASPAFWSRQEFDTHDAKREVLAHSAFVAPARMSWHRKWMYASSSGKVVLNPEPEEAEPEAWESVLAELGDRATRRSLREHIDSLAANLAEPEDAPDTDALWINRLAEYGSFSQEDRAFLMNLSIIARAAEMSEATWIVLLLPDDEWRDWFSDGQRRSWRWHPWFW